MNMAEYQQWLSGLKAADDVIIIPGGFKKDPVQATVTYRCTMFIYAGGKKFSAIHGHEPTNRFPRARITKI